MCLVYVNYQLNYRLVQEDLDCQDVIERPNGMGSTSCETCVHGICCLLVDV